MYTSIQVVSPTEYPRRHLLGVLGYYPEVTSLLLVGIQKVCWRERASTSEEKSLGPAAADAHAIANQRVVGARKSTSPLLLTITTTTNLNACERLSPLRVVTPYLPSILQDFSYGYDCSSRDRRSQYDNGAREKRGRSEPWMFSRSRVLRGSSSIRLAHQGQHFIGTYMRRCIHRCQTYASICSKNRGW